jgi:23S rRNA (guanosine2251-2'-O)-methyltransferase
MAQEERIFGLHAVRTVLERRPQAVLSLTVQAGRTDKRLQALLDLAKPHGIAVHPRAVAELDAAAEGGVHQGVVARVRPAPTLDERDLLDLVDGLQRPAFLLVLDGITDPHNLGACLRTADAAGVDCVIAPKDRAAGLTPAARKVAAGAAETVPFAQVTNLVRTLEALKEAGVWVVGTAGEAEDDIYAVDLAGPLAVVMGAEGDGMRRLTRETCDRLVRLPMAGGVESLNVSVATGVVLYEAVRQRRAQ